MSSTPRAWAARSCSACESPSWWPTGASGRRALPVPSGWPARRWTRGWSKGPPPPPRLGRSSAGGEWLGELLGERPGDRGRQAFPHASWVEHRAESYGRLAFLGDVVLSLAVSTHLYPRFERYGAGRLTKVRAQAVS